MLCRRSVTGGGCHCSLCLECSSSPPPPPPVNCLTLRLLCGLTLNIPSSGKASLSPITELQGPLRAPCIFPSCDDCIWRYSLVIWGRYSPTRRHSVSLAWMIPNNAVRELLASPVEYALWEQELLLFAAIAIAWGTKQVRKYFLNELMIWTQVCVTPNPGFFLLHQTLRVQSHCSGLRGLP